MDLLNVPLDIYFGEKTYCAPDWHWHSDDNRETGLLLWVIAEGRGRFETPDETHDLRPGDCFVLRMTQSHYGTTVPSNPLVVPAVGFHLPSDAEPSFDALPRYRSMTDFGFFVSLVERCILAQHEGDATAAEAWLRAALCEVMRQDHQQRRQRPSRQSSAIEEYCRELRAHPERRVGTWELASALQCSADHAIRLFQRHVGVTPKEYAIQVRIDTARNLLAMSSHSVGRIAELLGYSDPFSFSHQFQKRVGCSPSAYRVEKR